MTDAQTAIHAESKLFDSRAPMWWLVFKQELAELWIGGRVLNLLILFTLLMSLTAYLLANNNELSLLPTRQAVFVALEAAITFGLFIGLIISAESISGERERATLEPLLLTPTNRRQIVFGKFLAALTPWPVAFLLAIPYLVALSRGDAVLGEALLYGGVMGSVLTVAFACFGTLVSIWSNSNKISLFICLLVYMVSLLPAQLPTEFHPTPIGLLIDSTIPLESSRQFLQQTLVNSVAVDQVKHFLIAPILMITFLLGVLFLYAAPRLRLEAARPRLNLQFWNRAEVTE